MVAESRPVTFTQAALFMVVFTLPLVGIILLLPWAMRKSADRSTKTFAWAGMTVNLCLFGAVYAIVSVLAKA